MTAVAHLPARLLIGIGVAALVWGFIGYLGRLSFRGRRDMEEEWRYAQATRWYGLRRHGPEARDLRKFPFVVAKRARMMSALGVLAIAVGLAVLAAT